MHKFYTDLKEFILRQDDPLKKQLIPYYETLFQLEKYPELKEILETYTQNEYEIDYNEPDEVDFYSVGWFEVYKMHSPISFKIELEIGNMTGNYCTCMPLDQGYNAEHECCGINCDFYLPRVVITKEVNLINHEFQGHERDLWKLEEKWSTDYEKELQQKKKLEQIKMLEYQIEYYQKELELVKKELE